MEYILKDLNEEQVESVKLTEGYVRVIAGAGSGKTRALTNRYAYLVKELGISTSNILCVTFTNKAANEMKKRIRSMIGDNDTGLVCTFHGFGVQLLREDIHTINYPKNFLIMDDDDIEAILKVVYEQINITSRNYTFNMAKKIICQKKQSFEYINFLSSLNYNELKLKYLDENLKIEEKIFYGYLYEQRKCYGLDFDDIIMFTLYILENFKEKREKWQKRLMYVMVDEFQDVSSRQYMLVGILSDYHKNLFIVGDPDQTIYSWRGADVNYILNFDKEYHNCKTIILNKNYRSTPNILNASNSLIKKNEMRIEKDLIAVKDSSVAVIYNHAKTTLEESEWIAKQIKILVSAGKNLNDIAILYRAHFISRSLEEVFIKKNIKYILYSGVEFYKRKEIKDILSYLRMIVSSDDLSFLRIINEPKRNVGEKRINFLKNYSEKNNCSLYQSLKENIETEIISSTNAKTFIEFIENYKKTYKSSKISDLINDILNDSGYESMLKTLGEDDRLENISELKQSIFEYENTAGENISLEDYLDKVALFTNLDKKEKSNAIKMMTIHTAKGLEFPYVFICGMNEGIFPSKKVKNILELEEERRIAYVAYTRAEKALFLSDSEGVNFDKSFRYPSRFIFNTDKAYLNYTVELDEALIEKSNKEISEMEKNMIKLEEVKFKIGDVVKHSVFGKGVIKSIDYNIISYIIQFENFDTPRNINFRMHLEFIESNDLVKTEIIQKEFDNIIYDKVVEDIKENSITSLVGNSNDNTEKFDVLTDTIKTNSDLKKNNYIVDIKKETIIEEINTKEDNSYNNISKNINKENKLLGNYEEENVKKKSSFWAKLLKK